MQRRTLLKAALPAAAALSGMPARANTRYPTKAVNLVVPYSTGGATDNVARLLTDSMTKTLGQPMVVDNRVGANGRIGTHLVAKAEPDGYNLLVGGIGPVTIAPHFEKLPYDALRDLTPLALLTIAEEVLIVHNGLPVQTFPELLAWLKRGDTRANYGSAGPASPNHMAGELFKAAANVEMTHIPYKGDGAALVDLAGGSIQLMFATVSAALPHIQSGRVRVIAGAGENRLTAYPEIKTIAEQGFPGFSADVWIGMFGPAKLPAPVLKTITGSVDEALKQPHVIEALKKQGMTPGSGDADAFRAFVKSEYDKWGALIRSRNLAA